MKCQTKSNNNNSKIPCDGCKGHHIKCDKNLAGCKNCSRRGIECTYLISRKRRGPKTKVESMIELFESLNKAAKSSEVVDDSTTITDKTIPTMLVDNQINQSSEPQSSVVSSPMQATPIFSDEFTLYQATQLELPVYQDIYTLPIFDTNLYNFSPLPTDLTSFEPSLTIPIPYDQIINYPQFSPHFQPIETLDNNGQFYISPLVNSDELIGYNSLYY